ncbi:hypothetical protein [Nostocoides sp. HKS02]|uniref:hypothetical protein n=1 Tax=Nostocoides sp. HKS02 TaxID=1813880 RepID=UPI0018A81A24|nr:hypothetical protein [Tetrasphaera sp. HKS02]
MQGLLRPDAILVDVGAAYAQHLASRPGLIAAMGARSRTGFALKTLLGDDDIAEAVGKLVRVLSETSRQPLVLEVPSPLRWLARAQLTSGATSLDTIDTEHGEQASMYLADWLRRFDTLPVTLLVLDGRRADRSTLAGLPADDLSSYAPLANVADHFRWELGLRTDQQVVLRASEARGAVVPDSFWTSEGDVPEGDFLFAEVPADVEPERVLARLATLD